MMPAGFLTNRMSWTYEGNFVIAVVSIGFAMATTLLAVAFRVAVQLTRMESKIDENTRRLDETHGELARRIERIEAVVFPAVTATMEALSHAQSVHQPKKGN